MSDASTPEVVVVVKFRSRLSVDEVDRRFRERMPKFRELPGLIQKYYFHDDATGEWGGIYVWDSQESVERYMASDLRQSIPAAYEIDGAPRVESLSVVETLRT